MFNIGIIGNGFVGKATNILKCKDINIIIYDINPDLCHPKGIELNDLNKCEIIFISVPTPMNKDDSCYTGIIESVLNDLNKINFKNIIILRSTVPVGTSNKFNCYFMPEFLTEKNYEEDFINNKNWIFGLKNKVEDEDNNFKLKIKELFNLAFINNRVKYNNINFVSNNEAEMIKLFRNNFLATKISFCNEIAQFCKKKNINYDNVRELACLDERIGESHSMVPGHDGKNGFGGTCFPKDVSSLIYQMKKSNIEPIILNSIKYRNENIDRKEKDWYNNKGRAVVNN